MKKTIYLIAGANGSGKTTLAHELLREEKGLTLLNADEIALKISDKVGIRAGRVLLENLNILLATKQPFAIESTISSSHHLKVLKNARKAKYEIVLIYLFLDFPEANIARIKKRVQLGGHDIPDTVVVRRFYKSIKNFWTVSKLADKWKLYYNGGDDYKLVAASGNTTLEIVNENLYNKFKKGLKSG